MTDEIIINDVNVSNCSGLYDKNQCFYEEASCWCKDNPNCYYKQLQRKKKELKNKKEAAKIEIDILNQACLDLRNELEERNQQFDELKNTAIPNYQETIEILRANLEDHKKILEKIEEIAEISDCAPCLEHGCDCANCKDECTDNGERCMQYGLEKILNIINEVKNEK